MNERSARLSEIQRQAADDLQLRIGDVRFAPTALTAGVEALRRKYGTEIDQDANGPLTTASFACSPSGYQRITSTARLGPNGTCDDGSRSGDSASFDVLEPGAKFKIVNVAGFEACTGVRFKALSQHKSH
jgi:hypothetical protein